MDTEIKEGATDEDVNLLLSVLDYTKFLDLRNATAILLMYRCGLRIGTIARMKEKHVDFVNQRLQLDGEVMKNHKGLILPLDEQLTYLLQVMIKQNRLIRDEYKERNDNLFITIKGKPTSNSITSNSIQKQLRKYTLKYGIKNMNPHALRRGFAKNLYAKSNDLLLVSKALGHNDLSVTTKYLHTELTDVSDKLRNYL
ncbi:tyrosine-type recombinase/integrase [Lysinibacillus sp. TE18511]